MISVRDSLKCLICGSEIIENVSFENDHFLFCRGCPKCGWRFVGEASDSDLEELT